MTAGASVLDARKEKRRERCALCELNLLVNMKQNQNTNLQNKINHTDLPHPKLATNHETQNTTQILVLRAQPASG